MENIELTKPAFSHFVAHCLARGGHINRTGFNERDTYFPSYCNPSIYWDEKDGQFLLIQRTVSYFLHASKGNYWDAWGPLHYIIPQERGRFLETRNYMGQSSDPINKGFIFFPIEMKDRVHQWEFHGLEDARCVRWNDKLYAIGVRRDDNPHGVGRMEMCELDENYREVKSVKLKGPNGDTQYCIKNWMPVTDCPNWFIHQAANPTILVGVNPDTGEISSIIERPSDKKYFEGFDMPRGSSQCIPWRDDHHLCLIHTCQMWYTGNKRKFARYLHAFIEYDKDWNIVKVSPMFSFDDMLVEFCTGMTRKDNNIYISFALQDNVSYVLETDAVTISDFLDATSDWAQYKSEDITHTVWDKNTTQEQLYNYANALYEEGDMAGAYTWFTKSIDLFPHTYNERFMATRCIANLGHRDDTERALWIDVIEEDRERPEGYIAMAMYHFCRNNYREAQFFIDLAVQKSVTKKPTLCYTIEDMRKYYCAIAACGRRYNEVDSTLQATKAF